MYIVECIIPGVLYYICQEWNMQKSVFPFSFFSEIPLLTAHIYV